MLILLVSRSFIYMPTLAICKLALEFVNCPWLDIREVRTLFAMVHGFFGRISNLLTIETFFDQITDLIDIVTRSVDRMGRL